jgi:hypothetical protein
MSDEVQQPELRVMRIEDKGQLKTLFIALTKSQLDGFLQSEGTMEGLKKHILLVVHGHEPSGKDYDDARVAFSQNYTSEVIRR